MLQLDFSQIISQAIGFVILLWVLRRFAWRPLLAILDERRARIQEEFHQIAKAKAEVEKLQVEITQRLAQIDDEARAKIQEAVLDGKRIAVEMQERARAHAHAIIEKSKETIALELAKAKVSLRDQIADMTIDAVERLLRQRCDAKADQQLVAAILDELEQSTKPLA